MKKKVLAGKLKPKNRPKKIILIETMILLKNNRPIVAEKVLNKRQIETTISITKYNSKICKSTSYNKAINNAIYSLRWTKAIEEELQNLENY